MMATALELLIAFALSMGVDVNCDWLLVESEECVEQMSGSSSSGGPSEASGSKRDSKRPHNDAPPEIYNGF